MPVVGYVGLVGGIALLVMTLLWRLSLSQRDGARAGQKAAERLQRGAEADTRIEKAGRAEDSVRLERVVRDLKAGIADLERDVDVCQDPSVVRDRLRRLFAAPEAGRAAGEQAGAVPAGGAAGATGSH